MFFNSKGVIHSQFQGECYSVKSKDCIEALKKVKKNLIESRFKNPILHQDNSPVHTYYESQAYYQLDDWELKDHPPYSPDLSPCDFWLLKLLKKQFRGKSTKHRVNLLLQSISF